MNATIRGVIRSWLLSCLMGLIIPGCTGSGERRSPKFVQYYNRGEQLYKTYCGNCHQPDGSGLGRLYPPLNKSDYMRKNFQDVICLIRYGKSGEIVVNGELYNQPMPPIPKLTDLEIAEIATYIYNTWEHDRGMLEVRDVSVILDSCSSADRQ